jgi:uncharacterized protein
VAAGDVSEGPELAAGDFSSWISEIRAALRGERGADVPCGSCTACCTSSQFVHIGPDETDTLSRIPTELLFPAPGLPTGHVLLGYDERGHCPMLVDNKCTIYEDRPRTCRVYDCRIFPAADVAIDDGDKVEIARQVRRWRFTHPNQADRDRHDAVRAAASYIAEHADLLPNRSVLTNSTEVAVLAVQIHDVFLSPDGETDRVTSIDPDIDVVRRAVRARSTSRPEGPSGVTQI